MTKTAEHLSQAETCLRKAIDATGADIVSGAFDRWLQLANVHTQLALAYKKITG